MEFLKEILGDELFAQVSAKLEGNDAIQLANVADGSWIARDKYEQERQAGRGYQKQLGEANAQLQQALAAASGSDALRGQLAQLQQDLAARDEQLRAQRLEYRIRDAVRENRARNVDLVTRMIDATKVAEADGKLSGLDEQLEALKKSDGYLFADASAGSGGMDPHQEPGGASAGNYTINQAIRQAAGR